MEDHPSTLRSMNNLASVYGSQGRYGEAEALHKRVLAVREKHTGTDHPEALSPIHNIASVALFEQVLVVREKHLGTDHLNTLLSINDLTSVYGLQERRSNRELTTAMNARL
jgi:hypothetical protein